MLDNKLVYAPTMVAAFRFPILMSFVPSKTFTTSGRLCRIQPSMLFLAMSKACHPECPSWFASKPDGGLQRLWMPDTEPTKSTWPARLASAIFCQA